MTAPRLLNLALQGGGAHGAFTWGVLDALLDREPQGLTEGAKLSASERDIQAAHNMTSRDARTHGFGFAMVRQVVAAHGGWITGSSTVGEGTTFAIGFPVVRAQKNVE